VCLFCLFGVTRDNRMFLGSSGRECVGAAGWAGGREKLEYENKKKISRCRIRKEGSNVW